MPGLGDQHNNGTANPFEPRKPRIAEYTAKEIATLSNRLEKQLGPEYISSRPGAGGGKVHYLAAEKCINLANDVFGFNGWSSAIQNIQIDFVDESQSTGKVSLGLSVIVRVTLRDGTYHEDIGYGHIENCKGKAAAFEKAKKEGTTDGLKRALRNFGNLLGNCIYDKDYVAKVTKLKCAPTKWDPDNLHRHPDYASVKKENTDSIRQPSDYISADKGNTVVGNEQKAIDDSDPTLCGDGDDEFGSDGFDEADFNVAHQDHPDQVILDATNASGHSQQRSSSVLGNIQTASIQTPENRNVYKPKPPVPQTLSEATRPISRIESPVRGAVVNSLLPSNSIEIPNNGRFAERPTPNPQALHNSLSSQEFQKPTDIRENTTPADSHSGANQSAPVGFYTARAAESVQGMSCSPSKAPPFDPHLESPSIRKTVGIDHTKTKPVGRDIVAASPVARPSPSNFVNPQADRARRVGMPMGPAGSLHNRNSYKPPQMKRPGENHSMQPSSRLALGDVTSTKVNAPPDTGGGDLKRQKILDNQNNNNEHIAGGVDQTLVKRW